MYNKVKLGFCPIGKFVFSHEDAKVHKALLEHKMARMGVQYIGIDAILPDGIVRSHEDVDKVAAYLADQKIDCLFLPHCNFGTESAAGMIGKKLGVPVLLWAPRDKAPLADGTRLRDSLCGAFASSKVLGKLGVPFSYIENCDIEDEAFAKGLDKFLRAANVVKRMKNARIGVIGNRIDFFWSTIINESDLLRRFGIEVLPFDLVKIVKLTKEKANRNRSEYARELLALKSKLDIVSVTDEGMINQLAFRDVMKELAVANNITAFAVETFMSLVDEFDSEICFSLAEITDLGVPGITESDIHGAISSIMIEAAALNDSPSFLADLTIRHPENDQGLLLWHDSFPLSLKAPDCRGQIGTHWILPGIKPGMCHWRLKDGEITIMRFDGENGAYKLIAQRAATIEGPYNQNTYVWVEIDNYLAFERKIIEGPYIHHTACIYGDYTDVLKEACKFIDGLEFDPVK